MEESQSCRCRNTCGWENVGQSFVFRKANPSRLGAHWFSQWLGLYTRVLFNLVSGTVNTHTDLHNIFSSIISITSIIDWTGHFPSVLLSMQPVFIAASQHLCTASDRSDSSRPEPVHIWINCAMYTPVIMSRKTGKEGTTHPYIQAAKTLTSRLC